MLNDNKSGDIKVLRETLQVLHLTPFQQYKYCLQVCNVFMEFVYIHQAIRYQNFTGTTRSGHTLRTASITADEDVQMRRRLQQQQLDRDDRTFTAIWHSRYIIDHVFHVKLNIRFLIIVLIDECDNVTVLIQCKEKSL